MKTQTAVVPFRIWLTIRTGLHVIKRKAPTIIAIALIARFLVSQVVSGAGTFASATFALDLAQLEAVLVFLGSMLVMWFAVVPLTIHTIETPPRNERGTIIERTWRGAMVQIRTLSLRVCLRGVGILLVNYALAIGSFVPLLLVISGAPYSLLGIALPFNLFLFWVSVRWTLAFPAMIMEDLPVYESLRRSWYLTKSQVVRLFCLVTLTLSIALVLSALLGAIIGFVFDLMLDMTAQTFDTLVTVSFVVGNTISLMFLGPIMSVCYYYLCGSRTR